ncbi:SIS domain-containing protein [Rossellomorea sp. GCM10028870]|uniref:SIS domain-containing protein n=1 Tax=Rossellomorea sp. GCM10028870 TaxID=3273426 RepID=UPI00361CF18D
MELLHSNKWEHQHSGAVHTSREITQQPRLWKRTIEIMLENQDELNPFFKRIKEKHPHIRVILTGAGTSAFVGETLLPHMRKLAKSQDMALECIATTDVVSNPHLYLDRDVPTMMISFARSGNSPESLAAVQLGEQLVDDFYGVAFTCNKNGLLAKKTKEKSNHLVIYMPEEANDQGFAMTSSFTTMLLSSLLLFENERILAMKDLIEKISQSGEEIIKGAAQEVEKLAATSFSKVVYLGSGVFQGLARESSLKLLELTGGTISSFFDSSLGFRHGPKSILDQGTMVFVYLSSDPHTRKYDLDILKELYGERSRGKVVAVSSIKDDDAENHCDVFLSVGLDTIREDIFLTLPFVVYAQLFAMYKSIHLGFSPDNPSPSGLVNRVVKGVKIYPYENGGDKV